MNFKQLFSNIWSVVTLIKFDVIMRLVTIDVEFEDDKYFRFSISNLSNKTQKILIRGIKCGDKYLNISSMPEILLLKPHQTYISQHIYKRNILEEFKNYFKKRQILNYYVLHLKFIINVDNIALMRIFKIKSKSKSEKIDWFDNLLVNAFFTILFSYILFNLCIRIFLGIVVFLYFKKVQFITCLSDQVTDLILTLLFILSFLFSWILVKSDLHYWEDWVTSTFDRILYNLPRWLINIFEYFIIPIIIIFSVSNIFKYDNTGIFQNINNGFKILSIIISILNLFFQTLVFGNTDFRFALSYNKNMILNPVDSIIKVDDKVKLLTITGVNKGQKAGTIKILGICDAADNSYQSEKSAINNGKLESKLKQPAIYIKQNTKRKSVQPFINDEFKRIEPGAKLDTYYLEFEKFPERNFYIVFFELPNNFIFIPFNFNKRRNKRKPICKLPSFYVGIITVLGYLIMCFSPLNYDKYLNSKVEINDRNYLIEKTQFNEEKRKNQKKLNIKNGKIVWLKSDRERNNIFYLYSAKIRTNYELYFAKSYVTMKNKKKLVTQIINTNDKITNNTHDLKLLIRVKNENTLTDIKSIELLGRIYRDDKAYNIKLEIKNNVAMVKLYNHAKYTSLK